MKGRINKQTVLAFLLAVLVTLSLVLPALADGSIAGG